MPEGALEAAEKKIAELQAQLQAVTKAVEEQAIPASPKKLAMGKSSTTFPELLYVGYMEKDAKWCPLSKMKPVRCGIDSDLMELELESLGSPALPLRIPLRDIADLSQRDSGFGISVGEVAVDIEIASGQPCGKLRMLVRDKTTASLVWAALSMSSRAAPGSMLSGL